MYARVARFEGAPPDKMRELADFMNSASGPPEGVPSTGITFLVDQEKGAGLVIGFFETEEDLRTGDAALRQMDLPVSGMPEPASVDAYEVAVERRAG